MTWLRKHLKHIIITLAIFLLIIIAAYAVDLFMHVNSAVKLSFLGAVIGIPVSILITAISSNYEFSRQIRYRNVHALFDSIYKINNGLKYIHRQSKELGDLYRRSTDPKVLSFSGISSVTPLTQSSDLDDIRDNFDTFRENVYLNKKLRPKLIRKIAKVQKILGIMFQEINYISTFNQADLKTREAQLSNIHKACLKVDRKSAQLIRVFKDVKDIIFNN